MERITQQTSTFKSVYLNRENFTVAENFNAELCLHSRDFWKLPYIMDEYRSQGLCVDTVLKPGFLKPGLASFALIVPYCEDPFKALDKLRALTFWLSKLHRMHKLCLRKGTPTLAFDLRKESDEYMDTLNRSFKYFSNHLRTLNRYVKEDTLLDCNGFNLEKFRSPFRLLSKAILKNGQNHSALWESEDYSPEVLARYISSPEFPSYQNEEAKDLFAARRNWRNRTAVLQTLEELADTEIREKQDKVFCEEYEREKHAAIYRWRHGRAQQAQKVINKQRAYKKNQARRMADLDRNTQDVEWSTWGEILEQNPLSEVAPAQFDVSYLSESDLPTPDDSDFEEDSFGAESVVVLPEEETFGGESISAVPHSCDQKDSVETYYNALTRFLEDDKSVTALEVVSLFLQNMLPAQPQGLTTSKLGTAISGFLQIGDMASSLAEFITNVKKWFSVKIAAIAEWFKINGPVLCLAISFVIMLIVTAVVGRHLTGTPRVLFLTMSVSTVVALGALTGVAGAVTHNINLLCQRWITNLEYMDRVPVVAHLNKPGLQYDATKRDVMKAVLDQSGSSDDREYQDVWEGSRQVSRLTNLGVALTNNQRIDILRNPSLAQQFLADHHRAINQAEVMSDDDPFGDVAMEDLDAPFLGEASFDDLASEQSEDVSFSAIADRLASISGGNFPPSLQASPHSGHILFDIARGLCEMFSMNQLIMVSRLINESTRAVSTVSGTFRFLVSLLPAVIQDIVLNKVPKMVAPFLFEQSNWKKFNSQIVRCKEKLKQPNSTVIAEAEKLLKQVRDYMTLKCGEGWTTHVEKHVAEFETELTNAKTIVKTAIKGKTPAVFGIMGGPGIGKNQFLVALNKYLTIVGKGKDDVRNVYSRSGTGQFWEQVGSAEIVTYPTFMESDSATNVDQANELMGLCNPGGYTPNAAAIEKKDVTYSFSAITLSSNTLYFNNVPNMSGQMVTEALNRRIQHKVWVSINEAAFADIPNFQPTSANVREWISKLAITNPAKAATFPHLLFHPVKVLPGVGQWSHITQYNNGKDLSEVYDTDVDKFMMQFGRPVRVVAGLTADDYMFYCGKVLKQHGLRQDKTNEAIRSHIDEIAHEHGLYIEDITDVEPVLTDEEKGWKKILLGVGISAAAVGALVGILYAAYKYSKTESKSSDPHYGGRTRDALVAKQQETLARIRQNVKSARPQAGDDSEDNDPRVTFLKCLEKHTVLLKHSGSGNDMRGFLINGQHLITLRHLFYKDNEFKEGHISMKYNVNGNYMEQRFPVELSQLIQLKPESECEERTGKYLDDLVCVPFSQPIPGIRDRRGFFLRPEEDKNENFGNFVMFAGNRESAGNFCSRYYAINYKGYGLDNIRAFDTFQYLANCTPGDCGSPVWAMIRGVPKIIGLHSSANNINSNGIFVTTKKLERVPKEKYRQLDSIESVPHCLEGQYVTDNRVRVPEGNYVPIARLTKPVAGNSKTQLSKTPFFNRDDLPPEMAEGATVCGVAPAVLDSRLIWTQEEKYGLVRNPIPPKLLRFAEACSDRLYPTPNMRLIEWSILEAVNSIPHDASVGFGWKEKRKDLLIWDEELQFYRPHEKLVAAIEQLYLITSTGEIPLTVIVPTNKDETRALQKVIEKITRTFQISPIHLLVFGTMVLGDYMLYIHKNPIVRPSTVGLDPASREWHMVFSQLMVPFEMDQELLILDLDYKAMEANVTWQLYESYQRHLTRYYQDEDTPQWHRRNAYLLMMCQSLQAVGTSVYLRNVGNPSGMKGTTDLNSYVAGIMMAYAFKDSIPEATTGDYCTLVKAKYCGDDTAAKVHPVFKDRYNFFTIQESLAKLNTTITPAKKNEEPTKFVLPTELSFCKKRVLYSQELQSLVPFVAFKDLLDQLSFARDVTKPGLCQIINSALQWSFFRGNRRYNGQIPPTEPTFDEQRNYFLSKLPESLWSNVVTYSELIYRFDNPRSSYNPDMIQTPIQKATNASLLPSMEAIPHASLIASIIPGLAALHGPTNLPTPPVAPPISLTINNGTSTNTPVSNASVSAIPHSLNSSMPTMSIRHGELLHPGLNSKQITQVLDDEANWSTIHGPEQFMTDTDEMHHTFYAEHPQPIAVVDLSDTTNETLIYSRDICPVDYSERPVFNSVDPDFFTPTRLQLLYWMHAMWHGSLKFGFRLFGPREITCRIAISMLYGFEGDETTLTFAESEQYPTVFYTFDSSNREVTVSMPDINAWRWKKRIDLTDAAPPVETDFQAKTSNGKFLVWLVTPLSGINIPLTSNPYLYVTMAGGPDFAVRKFSPPPGLTPYPGNNPGLLKDGSDGDADSVVIIEPPPEPKLSMRSMDQRVFPASKSARPHAAVDGTATMPPEESRIMSTPSELTAGTAVEATGVNVLASVRKPATAAKPTNSTVEAIEIMKLSSKYFNLATLTVGPASSVLFTSFDHPKDTLKAQALLMAQSGRFYRGNLRILVTVTTGSFSGGNLIAAFIPYGRDALIPSPPSLSWITSFPYVIIDLASNKPVEIFVPYSYVLDYFDVEKTGFTLPNMGRIYFYQEQLMQPTTSPKPTIVNIQARWEDFETFVPKTIPSTITLAREAKVQASRSAIPHSRQGENVNNMVAVDAPMTSDEMRQTTTTVPLVHTPIANSRGSFADQLTRPYPWYSTSIQLTPGQRVLIRLPSMPSVQTPPGAATPSDGQNAIFNTLAGLYAAFAGDTVYDIVARCDTTGVAMWVATAFSDNDIDQLDAVSLLPLRMEPTDVYPSRVGSAAPVDGYTVNSMLPITTCQIPGKMRVSLPMYSQVRYLPANQNIDIPSENYTKGVLCLEAPAAGTSFASWNVKLEVYRSLMPGSRFALFTGMPSFNFDALRTAGPGPTYSNYPNSVIEII